LIILGQIKDALQMYQALIEKPFKYLHCWFMLRNEMKWNAWLASLDTPEAQPAEPTLNQQDEHTDNLQPRDDSVPTTLVRPIGRDRAKKLRSSSTSASNSSACLEMLQKFQADRARYEEQIVAAASDESKIKLDLKKRQVKATEDMVKLQLQEREDRMHEREDRIMQLDLDKVAPYLREYYMKLQQQIIAKVLGAPGQNHGDAPGRS